MSYPKLGVPLSLNDLFPWLTRLPWLLWLTGLPGIPEIGWLMRGALTSDLLTPHHESVRLKPSLFTPYPKE